MEMMADEHDGIFSLFRKNFGPRQVRTKRGIKPGNILIDVRLAGRGHSNRIVVLSKPTVNDRNSLLFDFMVINGTAKGRLRRGFLTDRSVIPYGTGVWNPSNYLLRTGKRGLTKKEISDLKSKIFTMDAR